MTIDAIFFIKLLIKYKVDIKKAANTIKEVKENSFLEPEYTKIITNIIFTKNEQVKRSQKY